MGTSHRSRMLVLGESLVDITLGGGNGSVRPGGSPLNVAVGLTRLSVSTTLMTQFADDEHGDLVRAHLAASGVDVVRLGSPGKTASATARLSSDGQASYSFDLRWDPPPQSLPDGYEVLHVGSLGATVAPGADVVARVVRQANEGGVAVSVDPNVRPAMTPDVDDLRRRVGELLDYADVVKLSDEDAQMLWPGRSTDRALDEVLAIGTAGLAVLTRGGAGAVLATNSARAQVAPPPVSVVDTIGAGDSFMSALLAALCERGGVRAALSQADLVAIGGFACRAAAVTCSRAGADPPWRAELATPAPTAGASDASYTAR